MTTKLPANHTMVPTQDGSYTFYSKQFDENLHSTDGAISETKRYFVEENELLALATTQDTITIFEVGFGLGHGFLTTLDALSNFSGSIQFISCEIDPAIVDWFIEHSSEQLNLPKRLPNQHYQVQFDNITLTILLGDAVITTPQFFNEKKIKVDRIFQDAFSPKKNPTLWTPQWFETLRNIAKDQCILTTYSASHSVRQNLQESNWEVETIKGFGRKRSATKAKPC